MADAIPLVDFSPIAVSRPDSDITDESWLQVGQELVAAFTDIGFCYITQYGIPEASKTKCLEAAKRYFSLPIEVKKRMLRADPTTEYRGWLPSPETEGADTLEFKPEQFDNSRPPDHKETYNIHRESPDDRFPSEEELPGFKETTINMIEQMDVLIQRCLKALGRALKLDNPDALLEPLKLLGTLENDSTLRYAFYPKFQYESVKERQMRCCEHTDFGLLTLIFGNEVPGLQVYTREEQYVDVYPRQEAILVNIADSLERLTGGILRSAKHRVMVDEETAKSDRYSIVYFAVGDHDAILHALSGDKEKYGETLTSAEFLNRRFLDIFKLGQGVTTHTTS